MSDMTKKLPPLVGVPLEKALSVMRFVVTASGFIMALTFLFVVIVRYGFGGNLFAYEEWLMCISFWGFFMGAVLASEKKLHINADIFGVMTKNPKVIWWRALVVYIIELVVGIMITYWAYLMVADEFNAYPTWQTTSALKIPFVVPRIGILLGFFFMTLFSAAYLYVHLKEGPSGRGQEERAE